MGRNEDAPRMTPSLAIADRLQQKQVGDRNDQKRNTTPAQRHASTATVCNERGEQWAIEQRSLLLFVAFFFMLRQSHRL